MKRLGYSILIGAGCALLVLGISKLQENKRKKGGLSDVLKKRSFAKESYYSAELQMAIGDPGDNNELIEKTKAQILYRLRGSYTDLSFEKLDKNIYRIKANKIPDTTVFKKAITASGKIEFSELFSLGEISESVMAIDSLLRNRDADFLTKQKKIQEAKRTVDTSSDKLSDILDHAEFEKSQIDQGLTKYISFTSPYPTNDGNLRYPAQLGYVKTKDTLLLNKILNDPKNSRVFPVNLKFIYGFIFRFNDNSYTQDSILSLYARKNVDPVVYPHPIAEQITEAFDDFDPTTGNPVISFAFNAGGTQAWYLMTERNVNRSIAIIANDIVLTAPLVESAIDGGKCKITGNFTVEEARQLSKMMLSGQLPLATRIMETSFKYHSSKNFGLTLIILILFVLASGASYGISFLIKPSPKP